ncbi:MAG: DUF2149 domain-containing protein [Clostridiales Family XIII bacterium]|jgi:hypothetical protein|nr:DUF2149 domain-containing protein [Clostridiales Family XIII bacterium]
MLRGSLGGRRRYFEEEDANPMEGAINIVDAMLVFACGLMLSLVIYWNVDIQNKELVPVEQGAEVSEMDSMAEEVRDTVDDEAQYERMGTVYVDPATGKMYLVQGDGEARDETEEGADEAP